MGNGKVVTVDVAVEELLKTWDQHVMKGHEGAIRSETDQIRMWIKDQFGDRVTGLNIEDKSVLQAAAVVFCTSMLVANAQARLLPCVEDFKGMTEGFNNGEFAQLALEDHIAGHVEQMLMSVGRALLELASEA